MTETGVMVSANVASNGLKSSLVFIENVEMNVRVYQKILKRDISPWLSDTFDSRYIYTQKRGPAYTANLMQNWRNIHFRGVFQFGFHLDIKHLDLDITDIGELCFPCVILKFVKPERSFYDAMVEFTGRVGENVMLFS